MGGRERERSDDGVVATVLVVLRATAQPACVRRPRLWPGGGPAMRVGRLRRRCRRRLAALALPAPLDVDALFADLAQRRGRDIEILLVDTPVSGPCALWVSLQNKDYVLVERGTDPLHQDQMKLHEWAHMVCGHRGTLASSDEWSSTVLPDLDPAMVKMVLGRKTYSQDEEIEAELMASMVLAVTTAPRPDVPAPRQPFEDERGRDLDALTRALEGRGRAD